MRALAFIVACLPIASMGSGDLPSALHEATKAKQRELPHSHCLANEHIVFNCGVGSKVASVCARRVAGSDLVAPQYRFGLLGSIELAIPNQVARESTDSIRYKERAATSSFASYLRFQNARYSYLVFEASERGPNDPRTGVSTRVESYGLAVVLEGKKIQRLRCSTNFLVSNLGRVTFATPVKELLDGEGIDPFELAFPR